MEEATPTPPADGKKADPKIITDMLASIDDFVPLHLRDKLRELLHNYSNVFSKNEWDLGWTNVVTHRIDTGDHEPVRQPFPRYPLSVTRPHTYKQSTNTSLTCNDKALWNLFAAAGRLTLFWPKRKMGRSGAASTTAS